MASDFSKKQKTVMETAFLLSLLPSVVYKDVKNLKTMSTVTDALRTGTA